jgi:hypothetical protein
LGAEYTQRPGARAIAFAGAVFEDMSHQVEVLAHGPGLLGMGKMSRYSKSGRPVAHRADDSAFGASRIAAGFLRGA